MRTYTAVIERSQSHACMSATCPAFRGRTAKARRSMLNDNLREVIALVLEDGEPDMDSKYVGTQTVTVA